MVWLEREQLEFRIRAVEGEGAGRVFGRALELADTGAPGGPRGHVAAVATDAGVSVLFRQVDGPCESGGRRSCARLAQRRLGSDDERGLGWSLPVACARPLVGAAVVDGIRYHALCAKVGGVPETTTFGIQFEPRYAHAEPMLTGCEPLSLTAFASGVAVLGSCAEGVVGWRMSEAGRSVGRLGAPSVRCENERPVLTFGAIEERLSAPREGIAHLLPPPITGPNDRAVWTGEAVLVASALGDEAVLRRFACERGVSSVRIDSTRPPRQRACSR